MEKQIKILALANQQILISEIEEVGSADILHMSPQNYTTSRKSVLSFNTLLSK